MLIFSHFNSLSQPSWQFTSEIKLEPSIFGEIRNLQSFA